MVQRFTELTRLLVALETIMRRDGLWHHKPPSLEAMNSSMPFAVDTLEFTDWLQFMFYSPYANPNRPENALPATCSIKPAAEVALMGRTGVDGLMAQLQHIDDFFVRLSSVTDGT